MTSPRGLRRFVAEIAGQAVSSLRADKPEQMHELDPRGVNGHSKKPARSRVEDSHGVRAHESPLKDPTRVEHEPSVRVSAARPAVLFHPQGLRCIDSKLTMSRKEVGKRGAQELLLDPGPTSRR